jgi:hypothetical protein
MTDTFFRRKEILTKVQKSLDRPFLGFRLVSVLPFFVLVQSLELFSFHSIALASVPVTDLGTTPSSELLNLRDPFKAPVDVVLPGDERSELEIYSVDQFKMVGVATGPKKIKAMLVDAKGKTHFVTEMTKIGQRKGVIKRITSQMVIVRERIINVLGQEEDVDYEIRLNVEPKRNQ